MASSSQNRPSSSPLTNSTTVPPPSASSTSSPTSPEAQSPGWHFPGPSSRYHHRERASTQSRIGSNVTQAKGPNLSTERRAHRRAQSSYTVPTSSASPARPNAGHARHSAHHNALGILTPPASEGGRSPLSRFASYASARSVTMPVSSGPLTPARSSIDGKHRSLLQDSPFSDYFTDDGRSVDEPVAQTLPTAETQQLLVRLNKLQSTLMRGSGDTQALRIIGRRMSEIERDVEALHSQSRQPAELDGSGLFMDENEEGKTEDQIQAQRHRQKPQALQFGLDGASETNHTTDECNFDISREREENLITEAQRVLESVTQAQNQLRYRYDEMRDFNHTHSMDMEEKEQELEHLRSQNEALKSDLNFDHTELLLLESQIKHLESSVETELDDGLAQKLDREVGALKEDWSETLERFRRRRQRYSDGGDDPFKSGFNGQWKLEVARKPKGRLASLTLRRVADDTSEGAADGQEKSDNMQDGTNHDEVSGSTSHANPQCASKETQTEPSSLSAPWATELFPQERGYGLDGLIEEDRNDCAITTAPPSDQEEGPESRPQSREGSEQAKASQVPEVSKSHHAERPRKSAWHELYDSMATFAGLGEEKW